jgi:hypothetical protein
LNVNGSTPYLATISERLPTKGEFRFTETYFIIGQKPNERNLFSEIAGILSKPPSEGKWKKHFYLTPMRKSIIFF